jgi:hypothetical protein
MPTNPTERKGRQHHDYQVSPRCGLLTRPSNGAGRDWGSPTSQPKNTPPPESPRESLANQWPLNQLAKRWLDEALLPASPDLPYLAQLLWEGFEAGLVIPGQGQQYRWELHQAAGQLLDRSLDPVDVIHWFISNPDGGDEEEQGDTLQTFLEESRSWEEAAQNVMEWFYDLGGPSRSRARLGGDKIE